MFTLALRAPAPDALASLRGYADVAGRTVDDVAILLLERRLRSEPLREDAGRRWAVHVLAMTHS